MTGEALPGNIASDRHQFDDLTGVESALCTDDEVDALRPEGYRECTRRAAEDGIPLLFCKAHDALHKTPAGEPLFPADATVGAIYLVRNPLDVVVSKTFKAGHRDFRPPSPARTTATAAFGRWHDTCGSGSRAGPGTSKLGWPRRFPVLPVRYEDLLADALGELNAHGSVPQPRLRRRQAPASGATGFEHLRQQEEREGFRENKTGATRFFHSGRAIHELFHKPVACVATMAAGTHMLTVLALEMESILSVSLGFLMWYAIAVALLALAVRAALRLRRPRPR